MGGRRSTMLQPRRRAAILGARPRRAVLLAVLWISAFGRAVPHQCAEADPVAGYSTSYLNWQTARPFGRGATGSRAAGCRAASAAPARF